MSKALVEIVGDATSYLRSLKQSATATNTLTASVKELKVNTESMAQATVAATVKKQAKLREEIAAYQQLASTAKRGSEEQIAAANHAAQSQQRLSRSLGVTAHESRHLSGSSKVVERDLGRMGRGALSASVGIRGMGRSLAFASTYFLGGAGLVYGLKSSVEAGEAVEKSQRSLAVTIQKTGGNVSDALPVIERWAKAQAAVGVTAVQAEQGLARASAITGSTTAGMHAYTEALLISKATGRGFNQVLVAAAKANAGSTTALARYIGKIKTGTTAQKLYNTVVARYKGQAQANTTASEKLGAALANIEATVGTALLPTINRYASALTDWLGKSKNQERIQRDVNEAAKTAAHVFRDVSGAVHAVSEKVGGFKHILELLVEIKLVTWAIGVGRSFGLVGGSAVAANGEVVALRASLLSISGMTIAPILIPLMIDEIINGKHGLTSRALSAASKAAANAVGMGGESTGLPTYQQYQKAAKHKGAEFSAIVAVMRSHGITNPNQLPGGPQPTGRTDAIEAAAKAAAGRARSAMTQTTSAGGGAPAAPLDRLSRIQNAVAAARLAVSRGDKGAKAQLVAALKQEIDFDAKYALIQQRLAARGGKDAKKHAEAMRALLADESSAYDEITGLTKAERAKHKKKKKKAIESFAEPFRLQLAEAKAGTTKTDSDDLKVWKTMRSWTARMIKANKFRGQALIDAWNEIARLNDNIANAAHTSAKQIATTSTKLLTANLGLSRAQRVELEQRIAQAQAHKFHVPNGQVGALGQVVNIGPVHVHGVQDPKKLIDGLAKHAKRKTSSTRGTHAGANLGLH